MTITRILIAFLALGQLFAEEPAKPAQPTVEQVLAEVAALKSDLELLGAKLGWCQQEMALWQNIPVMETRLKLAVESRKAEERKQALAARTKATPTPTVEAKGSQ